MKTKTYMESIAVQPKDTADCVVVPIRFLKSVEAEIDDLRAQLGLPRRARLIKDSADD